LYFFLLGYNYAALYTRVLHSAEHKTTSRSRELGSKIDSIFDVAGAFVLAETPDYLGIGRAWRPVNSTQVDFLPLLREAMKYVDELKADGLLDSRISWIAQFVNDWFASRGLSITLEQQPDPDTFYVGSVYEQLIEWLVPGTVHALVGRNGQRYDDAVLMDSGFFTGTTPFVDEPVVMLHVKNDLDRAFMMALPNPPSRPFELLRLAQSVTNTMSPDNDWGALQFPMVHVDVQGDIGWLIGMNTTTDNGQRAKITDAAQHSILKINQKGALGRSGFGMAVTTEMASLPKPNFVIDQPFLFWICRQGYPLPLYTAWVDYNDWKNPGELV
jgi:hypothetical protein